MIGSTLSHYKVTAALGAGGMGEVWRAEDEKLGREVALKVLPEEFARDPERMARFEREAKVLASLNHPNIATLYGLETVSGTDTVFLAMELVEGEDLSERIARGPVPLEEATAIALQIAEALEAAHEQGIVHRDLKPANIKLRPDGTVKVLDFGLAKAWEADAGDSSLSLSPTLTAHATAAGVILGTAAYMAPEQAAGIAADRRADIWAFGVVFWEMLTGHRLFDGETVSHVLASVLKDEIDLEALPAETPVRLRELIGRCLRKKPKRRLQAIGDARIALEEGEEAQSALPTTTVGVSRAPRLAWAAAAAAVCVAALLGILLWLGRGRQAPVVRAAIPPPPGTAFHLDPLNPGVATLSPDGRNIVFSAQDDTGKFMLYLRALDQGEAHALDGTDSGHYPFWSPDSRWIGFFADGKLRKIQATGGPALTICDAPYGKGGTWNRDGVIVFAPDASTVLHRVAAVGGESTPITELDLERGDNSHRQPRFLPDGRHLLFYARNSAGDTNGAVRVIGLDEGGSGRDLVKSPASAWFAAGYLLFVRDGTLMTQPFDPDAIEFTGDAIPIAENVIVRALTGAGAFSATDNGILVYQTGDPEIGSQLEWIDLNGKSLGTVGEEAIYEGLTLSPDGRSAAVVILDSAIGTNDIWLVDMERGLRTRFTFDKANDTYPVWSPDGESLIFASRRGSAQAVYRKSVRGTGDAELVYQTDVDVVPEGWSPDGRYLAFDQSGATTAGDLWVLDLGGEPTASVFYQTAAEDGAGRFSPDGRWLAYWSEESGRGEVYVTSFPERGRRVQVSTDSGTWMQWSQDGRAIFYQEEDGSLKRANVDGSGDSFTVGAIDDVAQLDTPDALGVEFAVAPDGERVLIAHPLRQADSPLTDLVVGWTDGLEEMK
jgi:Tol biopolymer transport system component/aminoglycoside phosphotransferase (APT) family kinase protein